MVGRTIRKARWTRRPKVVFGAEATWGGREARVALFGCSRAPSPRPRLAQGLAFHPRSSGVSGGGESGHGRVRGGLRLQPVSKPRT